MCPRTLATRTDARQHTHTHTDMLSERHVKCDNVAVFRSMRSMKAFGAKRRPRRPTWHSYDKASHAIAHAVHSRGGVAMGPELWVVQCKWAPAGPPVRGPLTAGDPCSLHNPLHPDSQQQSVLTFNISSNQLDKVYNLSVNYT